MMYCTNPAHRIPDTAQLSRAHVVDRASCAVCQPCAVWHPNCTLPATVAVTSPCRGFEVLYCTGHAAVALRRRGAQEVAL